MTSKRCIRTFHWLTAALAMSLWWAGGAHGSAASALAEIDATIGHIQAEAAAIRQLGQQNQLAAAYARLTVLNGFIQDRLVSVFYDRVQEVRREQPGYVPPAVTIDLGERFTEAFWDARVAAVEKAYKDAEDGLRGLAAQRTLDAQDSAWAYLGAAKAAFDAVKDIAQDLASLNAVGVAWDLYQATDTLTEQYTAIAAAKQAGLETSAWEAQVRLLISRTNKNLTRMKDFKSALIVNRWEVRAFTLNLKNIASFTAHAVRDPAFPLDFSDSRYNFDAAPYLSALQAAADELADPATASCWAAFERTHQAVQAEALAEKTAIQANIEAFGGDKTAYQNDLAANWGYFTATAAGIYDPLAADRAAALTRYNQLLANLEASQAARDAHLTLFADDTGLTPAALRTFVEADHGITQMTGSTLFTAGDPYVAGRWYDPAFPVSLGAVTAEMPAQSPALTGFGFDAYPQALSDLAGAYRTMAQAALSQAAALSFTDGSPAGYFAASPLTLGLMGDVDHNLRMLRAQALDFEAYMAAKTPFLDEAESAQQSVLTALAALVTHVAESRKLLCMDPERIDDAAVRNWENRVTPARVSAWSFRDGADTAVDAIDGHLAYIQGQGALNTAIAAAAELTGDLQANGALIVLIAKIIGQYQSLPALPSEPGYQSFLRSLDQLHAFFGPAQIDRVMDRRDEAIALFNKVHTGFPARYVGTIKSILRWFKTENPYCVMPEQLQRFQDLISAVGVWDDSYNDLARAGFPGWEAWARARLTEGWPDTAADTTPPSVVGRTPGPGSTGVGLYQRVLVRFDEAMDPATLTRDTVTVTANGLPRQAVMTYDAARHELVIGLGRLLPETVYSVALSDGATDLAGNPLVPAAWSFTTAAAPAEGLVHIEITGVADGGSTADPVTIGISVSAGSYTAWLARNDEPAQPAVDGQRVSRKGRYRLTVTAAGGLTRTIAFAIGGDGAGESLDDASLVSMTARSQALVSQYRVDGNRYFYTVGTQVFMDDLLTGESRTLFDSGYYYDADPNGNRVNQYAGFLDVADRYVLFYKNVGLEGVGVEAADKTFRLFVYDLETATIVDVPVAEGASITDGRLRDGAAVWIDATGAAPAIYRWRVGEAHPETVRVLTALQAHEVPRLFAFDGEWIVYSFDDDGAAVCENTDPSTPVYEYCLPLGDRLLAVNAVTGQARTLAAGTAEHPIQVGSAAAVRGLAGFVVYEMHKELVGGFMTPIGDAAWLFLTDMTTGAVLEISTQPEVNTPVEMSGSLLYFVDRVSGGPYNLDAALLTSQIQAKVHDLFSHRTQPVVLGEDPTLISYVHLFGDRLVTDHNPPRVLFYGRPLSPVTVVGRIPADGATDAAAGTVITVAFSGPMDPAALTSETVALTRIDAAGAFVERVAVSIAYDGAAHAMILTPISPLSSGARYRVFLDGAATDTEGRALLKPVFWIFATADTQPPVLTATVPAAVGSASLAPGAAIRLRFDEAVTAPAISAIHLRVNGGSEDVGVSMSVFQNEVSITPTTALPFGAACTLTVDPVIADTAGNILAAPISLAFRTVAVGTAAYPLRTVYGNMSGTMEMAGSGPASLISTEAAVATAAFRYDPAGERIFQITTMGDLYVMDRDGANRSLIDSGLPPYSRPGFTADGSRLLYTRQWPGQVGWQIVTNALAGGDPRVVHSVTQGSIPLVAASADGARIAFAQFVAYDQPMRLGVVDLQGQTVTDVEGWTQPVWSFDGTRLFARAASGETTPLAAFAPDLSAHDIVAAIAAGDLFRDPTGDRIAVLMSDGVQLADPDTGAVKTVINVPMVNAMTKAHLSWSRDGARFWVPVMGASGMAEVVVFERAAGSLATMVSGGGGMPYMPFDVFETPVDPVLPVRAAVTDLSDAADTRIRIDWSAATPPAGLTGYRVYRSGAPVEFVSEMILLTETAGTVFDDTTAAVMTPYYYAVVPVTASGAPVSAPLTGPVVPGDNDGLEDAWEWRWFGTLAQTPDGDFDGDGLSNLDEWREGTRPTLADTDGDGATDAQELARGFDPLSADAAPLSLSAPAVEVAVGAELILAAAGGSGEYAFTVSDPAVAAVSAQGVVRGAAPGMVTISLADALYAGLPAASVTVRVVEVLFGVLPAGSAHALQPGGRVAFTAVGGSGAYLWTVSDTVTAAADIAGARLTLTAQAPAGTLKVTLTDTLRTDLAPVALDVTIERIPGDITGDSRVDLADSVSALQVTAGVPGARAVNMNGDVGADGVIGLPEALLPLRSLSQ